MVRQVPLAIVAVLAVGFAGTERAAGAEAYLCDADRVVYVEVQDLERMKRTDPCIASYYGMKVEAPVKPETPAAAAKSPAPVAVAQRTLKPANKAAAPVALKALDDTPARSASAPIKQAQLMLPATSAPGTDYRNVRVLNAQSAEDQWFHHTR